MYCIIQTFSCLVVGAQILELASLKSFFFIFLKNPNKTRSYKVKKIHVWLNSQFGWFFQEKQNVSKYRRLSIFTKLTLSDVVHLNLNYIPYAEFHLFSITWQVINLSYQSRDGSSLCQSQGGVCSATCAYGDVSLCLQKYFFAQQAHIFPPTPTITPGGNSHREWSVVA